MINQIIFFFAEYVIFLTPIFLFIYFIYHFKRKISHNIERFLEMFIVSLSGLLAWILSSLLIKDIIKHPRPITLNPLIIPSDPYSFPSGHTTFMIAIATSMYFYDKKLGIFLYILGILVGIARVLAGVHYYLDILGGIVIGTLFGYLFTIFFEKIFKIKKNNLFKK